MSARAATGILVGGSGTVFNSGTINAATGFAAIELCGCGNSMLTLGPGSVINGLVFGNGTDTFQLGGTGRDSFNLSLIGAGQQYDGFATFNKVGSSNWTVTGTGAQDWNVFGGPLFRQRRHQWCRQRQCRWHARRHRHIDNVFVNGGVLAPGNSIGTLNVAGSLTFSAASSYMVEISGANSDLTRVTGVATLGGATVVVVPTGTVAKHYTILTATGGIPDTFNPVVSGVSPNLNPSLSYDANNVYLNFALNYGGGLNVNQQNVANVLTNFFNATGGIPVGFASLSPAGLTQVSGELAYRIAAGDVRCHEPVPFADVGSIRGGPQCWLRRQCQHDPIRRRKRQRLCREEASRGPRRLCQIPDQGRCPVRSALERLGLRL